MMRLLLLALALIAPSLALAQGPIAAGPATGTGYPSGAAPFWANATGTTSATITIVPPSGTRVWVCGITASALAGTGQTTSGSISNMLGPAGVAVTINFQLAGPMGAANVTSYTQDAIPCAPAMPGQSVVVTTPTSTAATSTVLSVQGYFL